jgi:peroxin-5
MSFLGGAECSTAGNPLSQFSKLGSDDKSLQRDRLVGRGPAGMQGMRSNVGMGGSQDAVSLFPKGRRGWEEELEVELEGNMADGQHR